MVHLGQGMVHRWNLRLKGVQTPMQETMTQMQGQMMAAALTILRMETIHLILAAMPTM